MSEPTPAPRDGREGPGPLRIGILSLIPWSFLDQRPQAMARGLARLGHTVYFVEAASIGRTPARALNRLTSGMRPEQLEERVHLVRFPLYNPYLAYRRKVTLNDLLLHRLGAASLSALSLDLVIVQNPEMEGCLRGFRGTVLYDVIDDIPAFGNTLDDRINRAIGRLRDRADAVLSINPLWGRGDPHVWLIPNGCDPGLFRPADVPKRFDAIALSNIAAWFDMDAILASERSILLVGPMDIDRGGNRERFLRERKPWHFWVPEVPRSMAAAWVTAARVGLVPFRTDHPVTRYAMPLKIVEYLLCDLPVVTYWTPGIEEMFGDLVTFYSTAGDRFPRLDEAIGSVRPGPFREAVLRFSWDAIIKDLDRRIAGLRRG